jgi:hypothetical protein
VLLLIRHVANHPYESNELRENSLLRVCPGAPPLRSATPVAGKVSMYNRAPGRIVETSRQAAKASSWEGAMLTAAHGSRRIERQGLARQPRGALNVAGRPLGATDPKLLPERLPRRIAPGSS